MTAYAQHQQPPARHHVVGEVTAWQGHSPERLQQMKESVARLTAEGAEIID